MTYNFIDWFNQNLQLDFIEKEIDFSRVCIELLEVSDKGAFIRIDEEVQLIVTKTMQLFLVSIYDANTSNTINLYNVVSPKIRLESIGISPPYFQVKTGYLKGRHLMLDLSTQSLRVIPCEQISEDEFSEPTYPCKLTVEEHGQVYNIRYLDEAGLVRFYFIESELKEIIGFEVRTQTQTIITIKFKVRD